VLRLRDDTTLSLVIAPFLCRRGVESQIGDLQVPCL
jgi:hypothetical protein